MWISEVFHSVQGEGRYLGVPSAFIRFSGCNLRCVFCDTPYTSWRPEGTERTLESVVDELLSFDCEHVVITGGEPLLTPDLLPLSQTLAKAGRLITIETAGTVFRPATAHLMSISPKLSNSTPTEGPWAKRHEQRRDRPEVVTRLTTEYDYQLKFVIETPADVDEVQAYLGRFPHLSPGNVYLMPQGIDRDVVQSKMGWLTDAAEAHGWRTTPRLHIELFGNTRGT